MLFQKENVSVRYVIEEDAPIISKWLTDQEVLQYYEGRDNPPISRNGTGSFYT